MQIIEILLPCYNEQDNVEFMYGEIEKTFANIDYDFVIKYIDDGSHDLTVSKVENLIRKYGSKVQLLKLSRNFGKEAAIVAGIDNVSDDSVAAILMDADGQMPAKYILDMVNLWKNGAKIVTAKKKRREKSFHQYLAKKYYKLYNKLGTSKIVEDMLDYQLLDLQAIKVLQQYREINRYYKSLVLELGFSHSIIEIDILQRNYGESKFGSFKQSFAYAMQAFTANSTFFLTANLIAGITISAMSFIYAIVLVVNYFINGNSVEGWTTIVVLLSFFSGVILVSLGIIGKYIALIFYETKKRPIYILDKYLKGEVNND